MISHMVAIEIAPLVNILGFITGAGLYAMLLVMVLRRGAPRGGRRLARPAERLLFATAVLGLFWNLGALVIYGLRDLGLGAPSPLLVAAAFTALGFLPAVLVDAALWTGAARARRRGPWWIVASAYGLSSLAAALHFFAAGGTGESPLALRALTFGFSGLIVVLAVHTRRQTAWRRALWAVALAVFAVSALHLSEHRGGDESWPIELVGHHASLPLALAILYQDYRFALADIFLKRALALVGLVALVFGLYVVAGARLLAHGATDPGAVGVLLGLWCGTALVYPALRRAAAWFVDVVVLRRVDYDRLRVEIARLSAAGETAEAILDEVCRRLAPALNARAVNWLKVEPGPAAAPGAEWRALFEGAEETGQLFFTGELQGLEAQAAALVPTADPPRYLLLIRELAGGRRLLSDDIAMLEGVALVVARRIDAVRVTHERCERSLREQEIGKLATEAELRALRAQLNPHFLFNALTTIGYLIQTAPERALETLLRLTGLLRAVLRRSEGEFATLGEELELVESYLAIERARFEERLRVTIDVPAALRPLRLPPLMLQPLVENAIKHGIAPGKAGGEVTITARLEAGDGAKGGGEVSDGASPSLLLTVTDSGIGVGEAALRQGRRRGVGLANVERRLEGYYGGVASLGISSAPGAGTRVEIRLPAGAPLAAAEAGGARRPA